MTEEETKKLITEEVGKVLWQRILLVASFFGIVNAAAIWGLWNTIVTEAKTTAETEVVRKVNEITEAASERSSKLVEKIDDLLTKVGETSGELKQLQSTKSKLDDELSGISAGALALEQKIANAGKSDPAKLAEVLNVLANLPPDAKAILDKVAGLPPQIEKLKTDVADKVSQSDFNSAIANKATKDELHSELADKISTSKLYRIKSAKGPVYVGVNNQAVYAGGLSLGDLQHNPTEPGLQWSFVENW